MKIDTLYFHETTRKRRDVIDLNEGSQICTEFDKYMQRSEDASFMYESMKYYKI